MKIKKIACQNCSGHGYITVVYENGQSSAICPLCDGAGFLIEPMTNADHIRAMSDEELSDFLREVYDAGCDDAQAWECGNGRYGMRFQWDMTYLQKPAEEG